MAKLKSKASAPVKKKVVMRPKNRGKAASVVSLKNKNKYEYWVEFDLLGEEEVREKLEGGKYGGARLDAAMDWIKNKEDAEKREKKRDADVQKAIRAARGAQMAAGLTGVFAITIGVAALYFYFS